MATRTFVVFQDGPSEPLTTIKTDVTSSPPSPLIEPTVSVLSPTPVTTAEKENLHPVTGSRSGTVTDPRSKKRKNTVLATKFYIPATAKKQRDSDQNGRKRKTIVTSSCKSSKGTKVATLGAPDLSKVEEVAEPEPRDQDKATQAEVDSKCYDLTVSPLADVSHAFDQVSLSPTESQPDTSRILSSKKPSLRGENGASQPLVASPAMLKKTDSSSEEAFFSTPERKQIYAAFTFTSPSPSSKRFVGPHLDIFGDIRFDP